MLDMQVKKGKPVKKNIGGGPGEKVSQAKAQ